LGKVLYEISTGKDRNAYPELPAQMGSPSATRDLILFNRIVLKACRANPRLRYHEAEEMMSDLLAFQFSPRDPFEGRNLPGFAVWIGFFGVLVMIGVVLFLIVRMFSLR
jgi:hypothetical protein